MATQRNNSDFSLMAGVDLPAFWETLKLRWWVIPAVIAVAVGFLWAQESDLQTVPGRYSIREIYEAHSPTAVLASVEIDPASIRAFPDANNLLFLLQSPQVKSEISEQIANDVVVDIFMGDRIPGVPPTYGFDCQEPAKSDCPAAISAYVSKFSEIWSNSWRRSLTDLSEVLTQVGLESNDSNVATKVAAIRVLKDRLDMLLFKVSESEETTAPSLVSIRRPTYTFGVAAGLLVALLILLQLTYSDSRIRSMRQLSRVVRSHRLLGHVTTNSDTLRERRAVIGICAALNEVGASRIRYLPIRQTITYEVPLRRVSTDTGATASFSLPFTELSVAELTQATNSEVDVIVVQRNMDLRKDLVEVCSALTRSGRNIAGVLLLN